MTTSVHDNPDESRYEILDGDQVAGFISYKLTKHTIALIHTEVDPAFAGRGLAHHLATKALEDARRRGLAVLPFCPYVRKVIAQDPKAYLDLVPEKDRERFELTEAAD